MGAGGQRYFLRRHVVTDAQPRDHAAASALSYLDSGTAGDGRSTTAILTGDYSSKFWIVLLAAYNVVFTTACLLLFDKVLNAE